MIQDLTSEARQRTLAVKAKALELGFHAVGIVPAENLNEENKRRREWLGRGFQGEMPYLARDPDQRTEPSKVFPDARSVVVVALNYYTPHQHVVDPKVGKVSRYAWGEDYHDVLGERLRELLEWTKRNWPEADGKVCVDIQPMMDKACAVRAGLGWMGKHTNVITHDYGSWVFIGELLLNLQLAYDEDQIADQCGSCTMCIDACPTGANVEPYLLDANLCISHATIESRATEIPRDIELKLDGWVYGCDVCQDVCPWNQSAVITDEPRFEPRPGNVNAVLEDLLELEPESYAARFRKSAMKRAKLTGLQRNARTLLESPSP